MKNKIGIYGAYGHTGKFIVAALYRQGYTNLILCGRDLDKLIILKKEYPDLEIKEANITDPQVLDNVFKDAAIIINCAGPYLDTAFPIIKAALRTGSHYIDLTAEQKPVIDIFEAFSEQAKKEDILIIPAAAFYGGLSDLLATALTQDWEHIDDIAVYIGLDSWHPTKGTRLTGDRNHYKRLTFRNNRLQELEPQPLKEWDFKNTIGIREVASLPLSEIITISSHLNVKTVNTYLSQNSLDDLRDNATPEPKAVDHKNRSSQKFAVEVIASIGEVKRSISATGQDMYAVTAPIIVEAVNRIISGKIKKKGVATLGEVFDATAFLKSLDEDDIKIGEIDLERK